MRQITFHNDDLRLGIHMKGAALDTEEDLSRRPIQRNRIISIFIREVFMAGKGRTMLLRGATVIRS